MIPLNSLERAVLQAMCRKAPNSNLEAQLKNVTALSRKNTGAGFLTKLHPDRTAEMIKDRVIGEVAAQISQFKEPMVFVLFMKDGYPDLLEGASIDDSTVGINFNDVDFKIL
jgi:hypothetical protein